MDFTPLLPRSADEAPDPLFPLPAEGHNSFVLEPNDGGAIAAWEAEALTATMNSNGDSQEVARSERVKATVALTDSRLVIACTQFQTGGGWRGYGFAGAAVAVAANAVSKAAATKQTKGYSLVGHVRHEWLGAVSATRSRWGSSTANAVSLIYLDPTEVNGVCRINLHLPKRVSTEEVARAVVSRAARHRLTTADGTGRTELEEFLRVLPSSATGGGNGQVWTMP